MGIGAFIGTGRSLDRALERVRRAEELGYESAYVTHIAARDSLTVLTRYATVTERIKLGTGVLPIFSRTPASTAQTAATIDEISGGRMVLGLGVSHRVTVENWFDAEISKPVQQMREYAGIVRAILLGEEPPAGELFNSKGGVRLHGLSASARAPDLHRGALAEHAAARRRDRRRRDALALQPGLHPRDGHPRGEPGT